MDNAACRNIHAQAACHEAGVYGAATDCASPTWEKREEFVARLGELREDGCLQRRLAASAWRRPRSRTRCRCRSRHVQKLNSARQETHRRLRDDPHRAYRRGAQVRGEDQRCTPFPPPTAVAISSRESRHALVSSESRPVAATACANRRNSLISRSIRRIKRAVCHRAVIGSILSPDHDWPSKSSSAKFVASRGPASHFTVLPTWTAQDLPHLVCFRAMSLGEGLTMIEKMPRSHAGANDSVILAPCSAYHPEHCRSPQASEETCRPSQASAWTRHPVESHALRANMTQTTVKYVAIRSETADCYEKPTTAVYRQPSNHQNQ